MLFYAFKMAVAIAFLPFKFKIIEEKKIVLLLQHFREETQ